ncbi:Crp/Fnr family transcriptional regulator [Salinicola halophilus]|uniref:Crp/Fnr family transcriptional regulator n=1 Tax=Salinicola halophilus TaxID=184065 RepID=UPI001EF82722|nr:Crp/Fnr family transcriptional regulator [Salinicola halophilus]
MEESRIPTEKGEPLWLEGDEARHFCTLSAGWAYAYRHFADGTRHILELFLPGDVIGLQEFPFQRRLSSVAMLEAGEVRPFSHHHLLDFFRDSSRLTALSFAAASYRQALLGARVVHLSRRSARQRIAYLLFELFSRLKRTGEALDDRFRVPLSQQHFADTLGLSSVHVSRTLTVFREERVLERSRDWIHILDPSALAREAGVSESLHEGLVDSH